LALQETLNDEKFAAVLDAISFPLSIRSPSNVIDECPAIGPLNTLLPPTLRFDEI
jgi:hypothetical protein